MNEHEMFPNEVERQIIRLFLLKEEPLPSIPPARISVAVRSPGSWMLEEHPSLLPIAALWPDGRFETVVPVEGSSDLRVKVLRFIFEELGDPRAGQPWNTWFPRSVTSVQPICGPMTLLAYRATKRGTTHG